MTFPTPRTPEFSWKTAPFSDNNHLAALPAGILAGDLMVVVVMAQSGAVSMTPPSGWTKVAGFGDDTDGVWWKVAVGGEVSATWVAADMGTSWHLAMAFKDAVAVELTAVEASSSSTVNCPSITPSWGLADNVFCAINFWSDTSDTPSSYPTNYDLMRLNEALSTTGFRCAARALAAASEDPPAQSSTGSMLTIKGLTLAIKPGTATAAGVSRGSYLMG